LLQAQQVPLLQAQHLPVIQQQQVVYTAQPYAYRPSYIYGVGGPPLLLPFLPIFWLWELSRVSAWYIWMSFFGCMYVY
jgi:hypothetical protein